MDKLNKAVPYSKLYVFIVWPIAGILLLVAGALPIIVIKLKLLSITLPFTNLSVFQGIIAFFGIYLIIDAFLMKSHFELHQ